MKLISGMDMELVGHPAACSLAIYLLEESFTFWTRLCAGVDSFFLYLVTTTYGSAPTKEGKAECWTVVLTMLRVVWRELRKVRVVAESAYAYSDSNPALMVGQYLWATLQDHRVQKEFLDAGFRSHPQVAPRITMYLFENQAPKVETTALRLANTELKKEVNEQEQALSAFKKDYL